MFANPCHPHLIPQIIREINQMEREMCSYLEWQLNVDPSILHDQVCHNFIGPGPYPPIVLPQPSPCPFHSSASSSTSIPLFGHCTSLLKSTQPTIIPNPHVC